MVAQDGGLLACLAEQFPDGPAVGPLLFHLSQIVQDLENRIGSGFRTASRRTQGSLHFPELALNLLRPLFFPL